MTKKRNIQPRIGIDIGRVIMAPVVGGKADTSFLSGDLARAMKTPPSVGALEGVRTLVDLFDGQAWLVSKCGPNVQFKTKEWLKHWNFHELTGLPKENVRFCLRRNQKAGHCKQLRLTHFIDDRLDVLTHLHGVTANLYLFGEQRESSRIPDWTIPVADWNETVATVTDAVRWA